MPRSKKPLTAALTALKKLKDNLEREAYDGWVRGADSAASRGEINGIRKFWSAIELAISAEDDGKSAGGRDRADDGGREDG